MRIKERSARRLVAALLLLSVIPLAAGVFRLASLAGGAEITPANARFFEAPLPVMLHILSTSVYAILGARVGHGRVHPARLYRDPAGGRDTAPCLDDARLCDWAWRGHASADRDGWDVNHRPSGIKALFMGAGWGINLAVVEWAIRRGRARNNSKIRQYKRKNALHPHGTGTLER